MQWEEPQYSPHSPDLSQSSFWVFGPLKEALKDCMFTLDDDMQESEVEGFRQQTMEFQMQPEMSSTSSETG